MDIKKDWKVIYRFEMKYRVSEKSRRSAYGGAQNTQKNYNHKGTKKNKPFLIKVFVVIKPCNIKLQP